MTVKIRTQKDLDKAFKAGETDLEFLGKGEFDVSLFSFLKATVAFEARFEILLVTKGSSAPRIESWGSSAPSIVSRESSAPRIESWGSSAPSIESWGSSAPSIVASGYVQLRIFGKMTVKLSAKCHVLVHGKGAKITGGKKTVVKLENGKDWCEYYGVTVKSGLALLYKGVNEDYSSNYDRSFKYTPGTSPEARECDDQECSTGLHFSPHPKMTLEFHTSAKKFIACWVKISEIKIHPNGSYPQKCKAKRVAKPCFEVNQDGEPVNV